MVLVAEVFADTTSTAEGPYASVVHPRAGCVTP
jgi:hypothetical protein